MFFSITETGSGTDYQGPLVHELLLPSVPLGQPPVKNKFTCVHMYELRVAVADKQYTILHWALARLLMSNL